jgi:hypothetical protein
MLPLNQLGSCKGGSSLKRSSEVVYANWIGETQAPKSGVFFLRLLTTPAFSIGPPK